MTRMHLATSQLRPPAQPAVAFVVVRCYMPSQSRRFPPPWTIEELIDACFVVKDITVGQGKRIHPSGAI
jgi:hypothetical protein